MELGIEHILAKCVDHHAPLSWPLGCWRLPRPAMDSCRSITRAVRQGNRGNYNSWVPIVAKPSYVLQENLQEICKKFAMNLQDTLQVFPYLY